MSEVPVLVLKATYVDVMSILYLPDTRSYTRGLHGGAAPPETIDETPMRVPRGAEMHMSDYEPFTNHHCAAS